MAFANGFNQYGEVDFVEQISLDSASFFSALSAYTNSYLYAIRVSAGTVTGGATLAPPQYGGSYNQAAQSLLQFGGVAGSTTFLDDFGNTWTAQGTAKVQTNQFKFGTGALGGGGTNNAMNGTSDYLKSSAVTSLGGSGNGGWAIRAWVYNTAWSTYNTLMLIGTAGGYGTYIGLNSSGKTVLQLSSNGTSNDIANITVGTATVALNTWAFVELTYDPIAGKYYVYVNGVLDQTITSSSKVYGAGAGCWIGSAVGASNYFMQGYIDKPEILPYCQHPNGTTYSVPTTLPSISATGYASDWFDTVNMVMKSPSAASSVAGNNPTFATSNKLYLGEAIAGASSISSVVSYAFQRRYNSALNPVTFAASTNYTFSHNLGIPPELIRITALARASQLASWAEGALAYSGSYAYNNLTHINRNAAQLLTGGGGMFIGNNASAATGQLAIDARGAF